MTLHLHPETIEFGEYLNAVFELQGPGCTCEDCFPSQDFEGYYRAKWNALASGAVTPAITFECGLGADATVAFAERSLRNSFEDEDPDFLAMVLGWLEAWHHEKAISSVADLVRVASPPGDAS